MFVLNRETWRKVKAKKVTCYRCKGFGGSSTDPDGLCPMCLGHGSVWSAKDGSGWHRAICQRMETSFLY